MGGWSVRASSSDDGHGQRIAAPGVGYYSSGGVASTQVVVDSDLDDLFCDDGRLLSVSGLTGALFDEPRASGSGTKNENYSLSLSRQKDPLDWRGSAWWCGRDRVGGGGGARGGRPGWCVPTARITARGSPRGCPVLPLRMFPSPSPAPSACGRRPAAGPMMRGRGPGPPPAGPRRCWC